MNFFESMKQYAQNAGQATGINPAVILSQWAHESTYGTSHSAVTRNNFAGLSNFTGKIPEWSKASGLDPRPKNEGGYYYKYDTIADFVSDYDVVMNNQRYDHVREAGTVEGQIKALATPSPVDGRTFAGDQYGGNGDSLLAIVKKYNLAELKAGTPTTAGATTQAGTATVSRDPVFNMEPSGWMDTAGNWAQSAGFIVIGLPFLIFGIWYLFGMGDNKVIQMITEDTQ